jgi:hypothetical protein
MIAKEGPPNDGLAAQRLLTRYVQFELDLSAFCNLVSKRHANATVREILAGALQRLSLVADHHFGLERNPLGLTFCRPRVVQVICNNFHWLRFTHAERTTSFGGHSNILQAFKIASR